MSTARPAGPDWKQPGRSAEEWRRNIDLKMDSDNKRIKALEEAARKAPQQQEYDAQAPVTTPIDDKEKAEIAEESIDNPTQNDDSMLSESLAKMYISRHKYSQALEIIKGLSLKYPEKSIYFADQIRFLAKLVLNETLNDKK